MSKQSLPGGNILMVTGKFLVVFGLLAVLSPVTTGEAVVKIIALVLLVTGVVRAGAGFQEPRDCRHADVVDTRRGGDRPRCSGLA